MKEGSENPFSLGDKVRLSQRGREEFSQKNWNRIGTVVISPRVWNRVRIIWDGMLTEHVFATDYLEKM